MDMIEGILNLTNLDTPSQSAFTIQFDKVKAGLFVLIAHVGGYKFKSAHWKNEATCANAVTMLEPRFPSSFQAPPHDYVQLCMIRTGVERCQHVIFASHAGTKQVRERLLWFAIATYSSGTNPGLPSIDHMESPEKEDLRVLRLAITTLLVRAGALQHDSSVYALFRELGYETLDSSHDRYVAVPWHALGPRVDGG